MSLPDPVRVLHFTDPHLFATSDGSLRGTVTADSLEAVVRHIVRANWPADLVVVTGDIIQDDTPAAYQRFLDILSPIDQPVHCLPGNHDVRPLMQAALADTALQYCESERLGNWIIVGIDSCIDGDAGGEVSDAELARLGKILGQADAEHVAVCLHHPPLPMNSRWLDQVGLRNADEFLRLVTEAGNVRATIFGHVHQAFDETYQQVRIIGTPSTCAQFRPLSDDFAVDDSPPAYRRFELHADGTIGTELIWLQADE